MEIEREQFFFKRKLESYNGNRKQEPNGVKELGQEANERTQELKRRSSSKKKGVLWQRGHKSIRLATHFSSESQTKISPSGLVLALDNPAEDWA